MENSANNFEILLRVLWGKLTPPAHFFFGRLSFVGPLGLNLNGYGNEHLSDSSATPTDPVPVL